MRLTLFNEKKDTAKELVVFIKKTSIIACPFSILIIFLFFYFDCIFNYVINFMSREKIPAYEIVGWIGALFFAYSALPQVILVWRTKKTRDLAWGTIISWFFGEILTLIYILIKDCYEQTLHPPLYFNYIANIVLLSYLVYAKRIYKE